MTSRMTRQRLAMVGLVFAAVFGALVARAVQLTILQGDSFKQRADRQHQRNVPMVAMRGSITDRNGEPLALSRESVAVYLRPKEFPRQPEVTRVVAHALDLAQDELRRQTSAGASFVWLRRQVSLETWTTLEAMKVPGIGSEPARQRVYPHGELAGQVLGFTNVDGQGLEGVERALDAELRGGVQALVVGRDGMGRQIDMGEVGEARPHAGAHVELTIDAALQRVAEDELERAVRDFGATAGTLVALDPQTGEVLAMATAPRFDPNRGGAAGPNRYRNRAITDVYEPGSTFKAFLAAAAIEGHVVHPSERVNCENGRYPVGKRVIRDAHPHGILTFAEVIAQSSNIGCAKIAERLGIDRFGAAVEAFGFGRQTGIDLPGEASGLLRPIKKWGRIHLVTNAFGQGLAVTPLQLTRAFAAIANGGRLLRPYAIKRITDDDGHVRYAGRPYEERRVMSEQTAKAVTEMLVGVTEDGTGTNARIDGFRVAGKTGTAQKVDAQTGRYHPHDRMSSFIGFVPADAPRLVILVVLDTPRKATYGGVVAAPVFRAVAEYGLTRRGILAPAPPADVAPPGRPALLIEAAAQVEPLLDDEGVFEDLATPGGVPSFHGLAMRDALVRAQAEGWTVRVEGSGYVTRQTPPPGAVAAERTLTLYFASSAS